MHFEMKRTKTTAYVEALAKEYNLTVEPNPLDLFATTVTELAGDKATQDHTLDIIVALKRAGLITKAEVARLSINHLNERKEFETN